MPVRDDKLPAITKLDAARRQIEFAIWAHFEESDPFAIHTVVSAALGILMALANLTGGVRVHDALVLRIKPGCEKQFWHIMNRASNFLKHADRDPDELLENVSAEINDSAIFMACAYYADLAGPLTQHMSVFTNWYCALNPKVMQDKYRAELMARYPEHWFDDLRQLPRKSWLEAGRGLLARAGRKPR